ncbi:MAG: M23 family metallopeptidase [Clostridia bacterium]|nr:M23 family metallopeptidase [Clostridia bacterium]
MANFKQATRKVGKFLKKNGYIFLIVICIAAIGTIIGVTVYKNNQISDPITQLDPPADVPVIDDTPTNPDPDVPSSDDDDIPPVPVDVPISFVAPVNGTVQTDYSTTTLCWNQTLGQYSTHEAVDFVSTSDQNVYAVCDGVVSEVVSGDPLLGNYAIITHEDGYVSRYYSLGDTMQVIAGQTVVKGDVIGVMSNSMQKEFLDGVHLHFEMSKDNVDIDPLSVLVLNEK